MGNIIMCADMDAFFASVEQQADPSLRGRPIAVIGSGARTVITTASYEARKYGIKTGMNIYEAKRLYPSLILVAGDNERYTYTCRELSKIFSYFTPDLEVYSIDEAFLDLTTTHHLFGGPEAIGVAIKKQVKDRFGINCTIGIAPNILLAKLASDISKPDGLRWIKEEDVGDMLEALPVRELWGIGLRISERLAELGIKTCGELGRASASMLRNRFGIIGEALKLMGMGLCSRPVIADEEYPKSIGHSMTLPKNVGAGADLNIHILRLSEMVGRRARRYGYMGKRVSLTLRYPDFETFSRQTTLSNYTNDTHIIYSGALNIVNNIRLRDKIRLVGISLSKIAADNSHQLSLFESETRRKRLLEIMDAVNDRYGDFKLTWAAYIMKKRDGGVISPAWRPSGVRHINVR